MIDGIINFFILKILKTLSKNLMLQKNFTATLKRFFLMYFRVIMALKRMCSLVFLASLVRMVLLTWSLRPWLMPKWDSCTNLPKHLEMFRLEFPSKKMYVIHILILFHCNYFCCGFSLSHNHNWDKLMTILFFFTN